MPESPPNAVHPTTRAEWRAWLEQHHTRTEGVWLISYKRDTGKPRVEYNEAVEEALCFGWIDSKAQKLDDERSRQWFSPRKTGSGWAKSDKERVARLIDAGLMAPMGLAKVEAAKLDGSWYALDAVEALEIPPDLATALAADEMARRHFEAYPRSLKQRFLGWIAAAKRPATRAKRIAETVRLAAENLNANQRRP